MNNTFAKTLTSTLMLAGFLLSSMVNAIAVSPITACSGSNCRVGGTNTDLLASGCTGPNCFAAGAVVLPLKLDCGGRKCLLAGHQEGRMPVKANARASAYSSNLSADDWGYWHPLGNGVSVRFKIVQRNYEGGYHLWTWEFKNDSYSSKVTYLKFEYTEYKLTYEKNTDYFPGTLRAGETFGGWAAFTAISGIEPGIRILDIERS